MSTHKCSSGHILFFWSCNVVVGWSSRLRARFFIETASPTRHLLLQKAGPPWMRTSESPGISPVVYSLWLAWKPPGRCLLLLLLRFNSILLNPFLNIFYFIMIEQSEIVLLFMSFQMSDRRMENKNYFFAFYT